MIFPAADRSPRRSPVAISLFSGAGGLDLGFEAAGFEIVACLENDPHARRTLQLNRQDWQLVGDGDVMTVNLADIVSVAGLRSTEPDVLLAGPPCQPFSKSAYWAAGTTRRMDDPRARPIRSMMNIVEALLPRALVIENVRGIAYRSKDEGILAIKDRLEQINYRRGTRYTAIETHLNATAYGVAQIRERVFLIAFRDAHEFRVPLFTCGKDKTGGLLPLPTAWDAIGDLTTRQTDAAELVPSGKWASLLPSVPEGENYLHHTARGAGMPLFGWRTRYWSFLLKLAKHQPAWTLQADPGPATGPFHWDNRLLSIAEMKRLQTIPDGYEMSGDYRVARRQIGNAVPPAMAEAVARRVRAILLGEEYSPFLTLSTLPRPGRFVVRPSQPASVPEAYWHLRGEYADHPGPGAGPAARERDLERSVGNRRRSAA
jgi:DNA (cytosine-5)-methyltransferase 1